MQSLDHTLDKAFLQYDRVDTVASQLVTGSEGGTFTPKERESERDGEKAKESERERQTERKERERHTQR